MNCQSHGCDKVAVAKVALDEHHEHMAAACREHAGDEPIEEEWTPEQRIADHSLSLYTAREQLPLWARLRIECLYKAVRDRASESNGPATEGSNG